MGWGEDNFWKYYGTSLDDLEPYDLTREDIIQSSRTSQDKMQGFKQLDSDALNDMFRDFAENPSEVRSMKDLVRFNLPVCDLTHIEIDYDEDDCYFRPSPLSSYVELRWGSCFGSLVMKHCRKYSTYGEDWPYE